VEYAIRDVIVKAEALRKQGRRIIHLNIGDPVKYGFDTPPHVKKALERAIAQGASYYSASEGLKELRQAVAEKERRVNRVDLGPDDVLITAGISEAIMFLMAAVVNPGDEVLMPGPCYPPYLTYAKFFDGKPVTYRTVEEHDWAPDVNDLTKKINSKTRLIVLVNPNNPCGSVYSRSELEKILDVAASHGIPVAADEIYDRITYDGRFHSLASIARDVPVIGLNGFSKTYLMTGWRLGYVYRHDPGGELAEVWEGMLRLSRVRLCPATPIQMAAIDALNGPQEHIANMVQKLKQRRDYAWKRINDIDGLSATKPLGAFYLFPKIQGLGLRWRSDEEFVTKLLEETGVLVVHGSGFDPTYGAGHFRTVFLPEEKKMMEAFDLIEGFMKVGS